MRKYRPDWDSDDKQAERLSPESIALVCFFILRVEWCLMIITLKAYLYLVNQDKSAWTWELDRAAIHFPSNQFFNLQCFYLTQFDLPTRNGKPHNPKLSTPINFYVLVLNYMWLKLKSTCFTRS